MSCPCCCVAPVGGVVEEIKSRKRLGSEPAAGGDVAHLVREAEEEQEEAGGGGGGGEGDGSKMDISLLREQYEWTKERQKHQTKVLLFRQVSEELSEAVSIIPVTQGLVSSSWEPNSSPAAARPPTVNSDLDPMTYDPWHVHLGHHRRSHHSAAIRLPATTNPTIDISSRRSSSVSEASSSQLELRDGKFCADSTTDTSSCREISPSSSFSSTRGDHFSSSLDRNKADPVRDFSNSTEGDPISISFNGENFSGSLESSDVDPIQTSLYGSFDTSKQNSSSGSKEDLIDSSSLSSKGCSVDRSLSSSQDLSVAGSLTSSNESSTPVVSTACSPNSSTTNLDEEVKKNTLANTRNSSSHRDSTTPVLRSSRKFSAPALRLARQLSFGGLQPQVSLGSSCGPIQNQHYYPFPHRKTPRKSEAARRLGMYSSF